MSLYEVVEVKPGRGLVLRDLVRGSEPVEVDKQLGSQSAARWDRIAARVLSIGGRHYLSGAVLNFDQEPAEAVLRVFRISPERAKRSIAERLPALSEEEMRALDELLADRAIALVGGARVFTWIWLAHTLRQLRAPRLTLTNFDCEEVVFTKVRLAVAKGTGPRWRCFSTRRRNSRAKRKVSAGVGIARTVSKAARDRKAACRLPVGMTPVHRSLAICNYGASGWYWK